MKRTILFIFMVVFTTAFVQNVSAQKSKVLVRVADKEITADEFLAIYKKNNQDDTVLDKKSLKEYLDLYINLKLKVAEAEALGMDTLPEFINELKGYRTQLAKPYLIDEEVNRHLLEEAYERKKYDLRASHILIKCDENAAPEDTLKAYQRIMDVYNMAKEGQDFAELAKKYSEDPSARDRNMYGKMVAGNGGDLSYFTVFNMVYPFEQAAYNTPVGEISKPLRTSFGYHILKVYDKKEAMGKVQIAHILAMVKQGATAEDSTKAYEKIHDVLNRLRAGEDFADLAMEFSDDKGTAPKGGVLPWFTSNRLFPTFYDAIQDMEVGQFSEPLETFYGYHLIKLIDKKGIGSFDDNKNTLKRKITKSDRADLSRKSLIAKIKSDYNYKADRSKLNQLDKYLSDDVFSAKWKADAAKNLNVVVATIGDKNYTLSDFASFIEKNQKKEIPGDLKQYVAKAFDSFEEEICIDYEDSQLENKHQDFRLLMQEYYDGILLFNLKQELIWNKAIADTAGLEAFYNENKKDYMWDKRVNASVFTIKDKSLKDKVLEIAQLDIPNDSVIKLISNLGSRSIYVKKDVFAKGENETVDSFKWKEGVSEVKNINNNLVFLKIHKVLKPEPKKLNEAKGLITADYQDYLEKVWEQELREKYDVKIYKRVLRKLRKK